jgi:hypothetical protein
MRTAESDALEPAMSLRGVVCLVVVLILVPSCARREAVRPSPVSPGFEAVSCMLVAGRQLVEVKLRVAGSGRFEPGPENTYLVDEATGEKFHVVQLQRIGPLGEVRDSGKDAVRSVTFRNREGKLRPGSRLMLVIGEVRLRNLILEE